MSFLYNNRIRKNASHFFAVVLVLPIIAVSLFSTPQKAEALGVTGTIELPGTLLATTLKMAADSTLNITKEFSLDGIAWGVAKMVIKGITRSTVAWINSGFQGNPAYVTNPKAFFSDIADQEIGNFIAGSDLAAVCSPFQLQIKRALILNRTSSYRDRSQCRLSDVVKNFDNFINGTESYLGEAGGWAGWWDVSTRDNPYSQYAAAEAELDARILSAQSTQKMELDWGKGFLSYKDCSGVGSASGGAPEGTDGQPAGEDVNGTGYTHAVAVRSGNCPIVTPGSVIENTLGITETSPLRQLELADSINEIVGALMSQLTTQVLSSSGLFGLSQSSQNSGNSQSYLSNLYQEQKTDYGTVRVTTVQEINKNMLTEQNYITAQGQSVSLYVQARDIASSTISCYRGKLATGALVQLTPVEREQALIELLNASSTIQYQIAPLLSFISPEVSRAQENLSELQALKDRIDQVSVNSVANFNALLDEYTKLRPRLHSDIDVSNIKQSQQDNTLVGQLTQDLQAKYAACLLFPPR